MPRNNSVKRSGTNVFVTLDSVQFRLTLPAFIDFAADVSRVLDSIAQETAALATAPAVERGAAKPQAERADARAAATRSSGLDLTLTFKCPTCGAEPGLPCRTRSSKFPPHAARIARGRQRK